MAAMSDYLENELLDHALGTGSWTAPTTVYVRLCNATETGTGPEANDGTRFNNEITGGSYAPLAVAFDAAVSGTADNTSDATWTNMPAGTVHYVLICDGTTSTANVLLHGALTADKNLDAGDTFKIAAGDLDVTFA